MKKALLLGLLTAGLVVAPLFGSAVQQSAQTEPVLMEVNIAVADNPISRALAQITQAEFSKSSLAAGIKVYVTVLEENYLRQRLTAEAESGGTDYDIYYIGPYEAQTWAQNGWIENLSPYFDKLDAETRAWFDKGDIIPAMIDAISLDGDPYGLPFYGESSFLMYNKEIFARAGLVMPEHPTWEEVYDMAVKIKNSDPTGQTVGFTMRGAPGWGMSGAPFIPMVNTYGGRFYDMDWNATVDTPEQRAAWTMYKKILRDAGQSDIVSYTYNECLELMSSGKCGMYYDATSLAPSLEAADSAVKGKIGYVFAPHAVQDKNTGWCWEWAMCINPKSSQAIKDAAFKYMLWASSKDYAALSLELDPTGAGTPCGARASTYELPAYKDVPYAAQTLATLKDIDFNHPCVDPTPYSGLQYIAIPEFADAGDLLTNYLAEYTTDNLTLDEAIERTQKVFEEIKQ
jgi:sorbitol/mannitol transport system substrate-binding protein